LYLVGQTRIHLDEVEGLGTFLELEVVLTAGQRAEEGHAIATELMGALEVGEEDLLACAYADLLSS
jgi:adenylate cyclase class IV